MATGYCEIIYLTRDAKLRWKWRHTANDGASRESDRDYDLFYDCLVAARAKGYAPTFAGRRMWNDAGVIPAWPKAAAKKGR